jgi:hypothetical protein
MVSSRRWLPLIALLFGGAPFAQSAPAPASVPNRQWLTGTWKLDTSGPPEDEKNWNRLQKPSPGTPFPTAPANDGTNGRQLREDISSLHAFGRTLIAPSENLVVEVMPDAITIRDDHREPTRYETTGRSTTMKVLWRMWATGPPNSMTVSARSSWNGNAFVQELWTRDLFSIVRVTRTFMPFDEGRKMLFVIKVLEPKLREPVKDIERVYVRQPS